jgi:hypothetical protein
MLRADHLAVAARGHEAGGAQRAKVMRDEVLGALGDPGEVADAKLIGRSERGSDR